MKMIKFNRQPPATARNAVSPGTGEYTHWVWRDTGIRRAGWTPKLMIGFEMSRTPEQMPRDGGTYPAGGWVTTSPTGKRQLLWD